MQSTLNKAQLPLTLRHRLWAEAANHATDLINGICTSSNTTPPHQQFFGKNADFTHLNPFGELTVLVISANIKSKILNKGFLGLYLCRAPDDDIGTNKFYNLGTQKVILSRDGKFMGMMHNHHPTIHMNHFQTMMMMMILKNQIFQYLNSTISLNNNQDTLFNA
jgi:hypothetical protein